MQIIDNNLKFTNLTKRTSTKRIFLHNSGVTVLQSVENIHNYHKNIGYSGIGYHYYIRKDGKNYKGRPDDMVGAHAQGDKANYDSVGICFEGDFNKETMGETQKQAGIELVDYLKKKYNITKVQKHSEVNNTSCPGKNFPFDAIVNGVVTAKPTGKIAEVQTYLKNKYGFSIVVDNLYGNQTKTFLVKALQKEIKVVVDGIFGNQTKSKCPSIRKTTTGNIQWLIQAMLICKGYTLTLDGIYGAETENVIKQFQKKMGIVVDGITGPQTLEKLFKS